MTHNKLKRELKKLERKIIKELKKERIPFIFLKLEKFRCKHEGLFVKGVTIPKGCFGVVTDFNFNKNGKTKPIMDLYMIDSKSNLQCAMLRDIVSPTNGLGETRIEENESIGLVLRKPDGRVNLSCYITGYIQHRTNEVKG